MTIDSCFLWGRIIKAHGLKGEALVHFEAEEPEQFIDLESVFVEINQKLIPFFIEDLSINGNKGILKFEDVDDPEDISPLLSKNLYLPIETLPELEENQFYYHEVTNYSVEDQKFGELGIVKEIYEMPGQDLINMTYKGKEVLIPINNDIVLKADHEKKKILVNLPEGLLELYLTDTHEPDDED